MAMERLQHQRRRQSLLRKQQPQLKLKRPAAATARAATTGCSATTGSSSASSSGETCTTAPPVESQPKTDGSVATAEELRRTKSSPLVRKIAQEHNVDISKLEGTGLSGRVTKNDILSFIESGSAPAPAAPAQRRCTCPLQEPVAPAPPRPQVGDRVEQMSVMRKKIAEHMVLSRRTSAHVTTVYEIDMTRRRAPAR